MFLVGSAQHIGGKKIHDLGQGEVAIIDVSLRDLNMPPEEEFSRCVVLEKHGTSFPSELADAIGEPSYPLPAHDIYKCSLRQLPKQKSDCGILVVRVPGRQKAKL
jgi:hypothetical protein